MYSPAIVHQGGVESITCHQVILDSYVDVRSGYGPGRASIGPIIHEDACKHQLGDNNDTGERYLSIIPDRPARQER